MFRLVVKRVRVVLTRSLGVAIYQDVNFGRTDAAAIYAGNRQRGAYLQGCNCPLKEFGWNSGVNQCSQKHVAADAGEAVEVGGAAVGPWSLVLGRRLLAPS